MTGLIFGRRLFGAGLAALVLTVGAVPVSPGPAIAAEKPAQKKLPPEEQVLFGGRVPKDVRRAHQARMKDIKAQKLDGKKLSLAAAEEGWELLADSKYGEATRKLNEAWLLDPKSARVFWGFALVRHFRDDSYKGARAMFRRARQLDPRDTELLMDYAHFLAEYKQTGGAIAAYKSILRMRPEAGNAHRGLALAYHKTNRIKLACKHIGLAKKDGREMDKNFVREVSMKAKTAC